MTVRNQLEILQQMQRQGFNICTCGNCGGIILFNKEAKEAMEETESGESLICPHCKEEMAYSDCPDLYYEGSPDLEEDFLEKFLPNYFSREDVALYNDLFKLYYNEFGIGDEANHLLEESYQSDLSNPKIGRDLKQLEQSLYKEARKNYLKESKK